MPYFSNSRKDDDTELVMLTDADIPSPVGKSRRFGVGYAHTPGRKTENEGDVSRPVMEDLLLIKGRFRNRDDEDLFAVFDGHDGSTAARVAASRFDVIFEQELEVASKYSDAEVQELMEEVEVHSRESLDEKQKRTAVALHRSFGQLNEELKIKLKEDGYGGTTALITFFDNRDLYVANVGDTRAVLGKRYGKHERVSIDHKPIEGEKDRIEASGGKVYCASVPRVEGTLAISRVLGDFDLAGKGIIWHPHIRVVNNFRDAAQFIVLASDGLWDLVSDQDAVNIVLDELEFAPSGPSSSSSSFTFGNTAGAKSYARRKSRDGEQMMFGGDDDDFFGDSSPQATSVPINSSNNSFEIDNESEIEASISLVRRAFCKNALDNISVVVVRFT